MSASLAASVATQQGFRLHRLEVCNWGTFDSVNDENRGRIYSVAPEGNTTLLIGRNGTGKSTLVDALLTLLVRPQVRNYNVAAGAKKQERDLRTYIKGAYDQQSGEDDNRAVCRFHRPDGKHSSILLACFRNAQTHRVFTLAQVLYVTADGKADKVYCMSPDERSIHEDLSGLRSTDRLKTELKQRGFRVTTSYTEYFGWVKKQTGVQDLAMDLFNQTVAMKDIGGLTKFIREQMLEARPWNEKIDRLLGHFNQLNEAWQSLLRVRRQHELLLPVREYGEKYTRGSVQLDRARRIFEAADSFFCQKRIDLFMPECDRLKETLDELLEKEERLTESLHEVQDECRRLVNEIEQAGGQRMREIPSLIRVEQAHLARKRNESDRLHRTLEQASVARHVADEKSLKQVRKLLTSQQSELTESAAETQRRRDDRNVERATLVRTLRDDEHELTALQRRQGNLPEWIAEVRQQLCDDLGYSIRDLPFAAELIAVRPEEQSWESSIELELRGFALSLLVPERCYRSVSEYVEKTRLRDSRNRGQKLVYLKVGKRGDAKNAPVPHPQSLVQKLEFKPAHPLLPWVRAELENRFDYRCCETIAEFQKYHGRAMTRTRHVKSGSVRHSKDDRDRSVDPRGFVLGWDNGEKKRRLLESIERQQEQISQLDNQVAQLDTELAEQRLRQTAVQQALEFTDFEAINFAGHEAAIEQLERELRGLKKGNKTINLLEKTLAERQQLEQALELQKRQSIEQQGDLKRQVRSGEQIIENSFRVLEERETDGTLAAHQESFDAVETCFDDQPLTVEDVIPRESAFKDERRAGIDGIADQLAPVRSGLLKSMSQFLRHCPEETSDLEPGIEYLSSFVGRLDEIEAEGLPEHSQRFRERLNDKVTREIQLLHTELDQERDTIEDRIDLLNESLARIPWKPGTHMRLEAQLVRDAEITAFRQALLECLSSNFDGTPEADEARFIEIEKLIGRLKEESRWRDRVTDVRKWFDFAAREIDDETGEGRSYYQDSAGQSGGEKAKLAFTILVAAIAYQYDIEPHREVSDRFHFVIVDEMFSRIDDQYSQYALDLFQQFGLQLLIVAPLDAKARITQPYVGCYLLSTKDEQNYSHIHQMTAREFREQVETPDTPAPRRPRRPR